MSQQTKPGALTGIKVLDLSRILGGPLCGQILGDHGADVLVEPPQGDDTRAWGRRSRTAWRRTISGSTATSASSFVISALRRGSSACAS